MYNIYSRADLAGLRASGRVNTQVHCAVRQALQPGVRTADLAAVANAVLQQTGATSSLPELGFPAALCVSVNEETGHGVPGPRILQPGDWVKIDVSVQLEGWHTDAATTYTITDTGAKPNPVARPALWAALAAVLPGRPLSDVAHAAWRAIKSAGATPVRTAFGHGIGRALHEPPQLPSFGPPGQGPRMRSGLTLAVEPVVSTGRGLVLTGPDGWVQCSADGSRTAHEERSLWLSPAGPLLLTPLPDDAAEPCSPGLMFRQATRQDQPYLLHLAHQTMDDVLTRAWGRRVRAEEVLNPPSGTVWVLSATDGQPVGMVAYSAPLFDPLYIHTLLIDPHCQGQGRGTQVLAALAQVARWRGAEALELSVQVVNERALRWYQRLGFEPCGPVRFGTQRLRKQTLGGVF
ncbi:MAG: type I methionyl aminopeptidase [Alicyclobacillus sp.]|nr:type I methionyl aminopeptidase [Alicyclobacillus sp.]